MSFSWSYVNHFLIFQSFSCKQGSTASQMDVGVTVSKEREQLPIFGFWRGRHVFSGNTNGIAQDYWHPPLPPLPLYHSGLRVFYFFLFFVRFRNVPYLVIYFCYLWIHFIIKSNTQFYIVFTISCWTLKDAEQPLTEEIRVCWTLLSQWTLLCQ